MPQDRTDFHLTDRPEVHARRGLALPPPLHSWRWRRRDDDDGDDENNDDDDKDVNAEKNVTSSRSANTAFKEKRVTRYGYVPP